MQFFPVLVFTVYGQSMEPILRNGDKVIAVSTFFVRLKKDDVVVCLDPRTKRILIKRITQLKGNTYFVEGDNKSKSTDSREFGPITKENIFAKVIYPKTMYYS